MPQPERADLIAVVDYNPLWQEEFLRERERIMTALDVLTDGVVAIEHVGSTAVPGCAAKPIIDIMIGVRPLAHGERCIAPLESLGYQYKGEQGIAGRYYFGKGDPQTHHLHLVEHGSFFWNKQLRFRDRLRARSDLAEHYSALKRRLAAEFSDDRIGYTFAKTPFIEAVVAYGCAVTEGEALVIREYDAEWPLYFDLENEAILAALDDAATEVVAIEHVGSTAVPGLAAKPIIDIAIGVPKLEAGRRIVRKLEAIGYRYENDREAEVEDEELYLFKGAPHTHHVHVIEHGGRVWQRDIGFRDLLRTDAGLAARYAALKLELMAKHHDNPDVHAYAHAKTPFIEGALARAIPATNDQRPSR